MSDFNLIVLLLGSVLVVLGLPSALLSRSPFPPTLLALLFGVAVGPVGLDLIDPARLGEPLPILERFARLTLGIGLVGVALRIPRHYPRRRVRDLGVLVGAGMLLMWGIGTALVHFILQLPFWLAALIGAIIAPTDPVAASSIVTGTEAEENIPEGIRHAISFESGINDGLSYVFVYLSFLLLSRPAGDALSHWFLHTVLWEVLAATVLGVGLGLAAAGLLRIAEEHEAIESQWRLVYMVALALFAIGAGELIGSDEILVAFAAGATFVQRVSESERGEEERGQEAVNRFFAIPVFVLIGTLLPWDGWRELGVAGPLLAVAVLFGRRPPVILLLRPFLRDVRTLPGALYVGWFGPIAVAAAYYAALMSHRMAEPVIWHVVSLVICASVVGHGTTSAVSTRWLGRAVGLKSPGRGDDASVESGSAEPDETFSEGGGAPDPAEPAREPPDS